MGFLCPPELLGKSQSETGGVDSTYRDTDPVTSSPNRRSREHCHRTLWGARSQCQGGATGGRGDGGRKGLISPGAAAKPEVQSLLSNKKVVTLGKNCPPGWDRSIQHEDQKGLMPEG